MGFVEAVRTCLEKYATFSGRARRSEYWWFFLFGVLSSLVANVLDALVFGVSVEPVGTVQDATTSGLDVFYFVPSIFGLALGIALLLPSISVAVRRLHDRGKSGWWWWLWLLPIIGWIIMLIWYVSRGTIGPNAYGPDPVDADNGTNYPRP